MRKYIFALISAFLSIAPVHAQLVSQQTWAGTAGGTSTALTVAIHNVVALNDLLGVPIRLLPNGVNPSAATIAIVIDAGGTLGPVAIKKPSPAGLVALTGKEMVSGQAVVLVYDGAEMVMTSGIQGAMVVGSMRNLTGTAPGQAKTATWAWDELVLESGLGGAAYKATSISGLAFNGATVGAGGMDTGGTPTSADLFIYAIYNPTTGAVSTLGTVAGAGSSVYGGSNMPAGYVYSSLIWAGETDVSGNVKTFRQVDRQIAASTSTALSGAASPTLTPVSLIGIVPINAKGISGTLTLGTNSGDVSNNSFTVQPTIGNNVGQIIIQIQQGPASGGGFGINVPFSGFPLVEAQTIYYFYTSRATGLLTILVSGYTI